MRYVYRIVDLANPNMVALRAGQAISAAEMESKLRTLHQQSEIGVLVSDGRSISGRKALLIERRTRTLLEELEAEDFHAALDGGQ